MLRDLARMNEEGARSESEYEALLELLPLPACLVDDEGSYIARGQWWIIPGHLPLEYGTKWQWLVALADRRETALTWNRAVATGDEYRQRCRLAAPDVMAGRWYAVDATQVRSEPPGMWLVTATDIHDIKESEARMTEFIAFLAHELAGPLTTISGNVHILNSRGARVPPELRQTALEDVEAETLRMLRLTNGLLKLARMETTPASIARIDLDTMLGELATHHHDAHPTRRISVANAVNVYVHAVPDYVEEIVGNYLANAEKYSPDPTTDIEIAVRTYPRAIEVVVLDRGIGVAAEDVDRLFLPFVRGSATVQTNGSGIGLAICKRLAELQGASIWAAPREGGGSEFGIRLSRAPSEPPD
jgi:signal transduction histidine kinase